MEEIGQIIKYDLSQVINNAVSSEKSFCTGFSGTGDSKSYIMLFKMSADSVKIDDMDAKTQISIAKERCLRNDAYMGQVNLHNGGNYCGLDGAIWGLDLVRPIEIEQQKPFFLQPQFNGTPIPVYSLSPLLNATERLLGYAGQQRYPIKPGSHLFSITETAESTGPRWVWAIMAIAIPASRSDGSCYLLSDSGTYGHESDNESDMIGYIDGIMRRVTKAIALHGEDHTLPYEKIYLGYTYQFVEPGYLGCAMACAPCIRLAKDCIPYGVTADELQAISTLKWERTLNLPPL